MRLNPLSRLLYLAPLLVLFGCANTTPTQPEIKNQVFAALQREGLSQDALAFVAYPLAQPQQQISHQPERAMQPASTMKLLTSIVALEQLGPDYRGKTRLLSFLPPETSLAQPLVLQGMGSMDFTVQELWYLLKQAYDQGIRQVPAILVDRHWLTPARPELTALPFDETPRQYYNLLPDALFLQRNMLGVRLQSDADAVHGALFPVIQGLELLTSEVTLTDDSCASWYPDSERLAFKRQPDQLQLILQIEFPKNCQKQHYLQLINRADFTRLLVQQLWQDISGQAQVPVLEQQGSGATVLLAEHQSRTLAELLREINKSSDNAMTRLLYLSLGAQTSAGTAETAGLAEQQVRQFLTEAQLDAGSLQLENGSGLSRTERISPQLMVSLLQHAYQAPYQPELLASLPLAGTDGTLKRRLTQAETKGKARLKTGTLRNVVALAGYVTDRSGRTWVVASFINHPNAGLGRPVLDQLIEWITQQD